MSGYEDLSISYAYARYATSSPSSHLWEYSTDGINWSTIGTITGPTYTVSPVTYTTVSLAPFDGLDGASTAYLRMTFLGGTGTSSSTYNRIDNIQLNAIAVPEPSIYGLLILAAFIGLTAIRRIRKNTAVA